MITPEGRELYKKKFEGFPPRRGSGTRERSNGSHISGEGFSCVLVGGIEFFR